MKLIYIMKFILIMILPYRLLLGSPFCLDILFTWHKLLHPMSDPWCGGLPYPKRLWYYCWRTLMSSSSRTSFWEKYSKDGLRRSCHIWLNLCFRDTGDSIKELNQWKSRNRLVYLSSQFYYLRYLSRNSG